MIDKQLKIIRVSETVTVVFMHSTIMYGGAGIVQPKISSKFFGFISWYFFSFTMELFIFLSGITYGICVNRPNGYYKNFTLIKHKFKRLMIPYYIFGIFYVAPVMKILKITKDSYLKYTLKGIIFANNCRHLWYLLALFDIFIFIVIFDFLIDAKNKAQMFFILSVILLFLTRKLPDIMAINRAFYYLPFFCLGFYLYDKIEMINTYFSVHLIVWIILGLISFPLSLIRRTLYDWVKAIRTIPALFFFLYLNNIFTKLPIYDNFLFEIILKNGLGIYLIHPMLLYFIYFRYGQKEIKPCILVFSTTFMAFILSLFITEIFRLLNLDFVFGK